MSDYVPSMGIKSWPIKQAAQAAGVNRELSTACS